MILRICPISICSAALLVVVTFLSDGAHAGEVTLNDPNLQEGNRFGEIVGALDDVNGSGSPDAIVGAPQETVNGQGAAGRAYVFDGSTGVLIYTLQSPSPEVGGQFGIGVSGVPDTNGDGVGDILVGSVNDGALVPDAEDAGRAYLFDGATGDLITTFRSLNTEDANFGFSVEGLEDITGDTMGDIAVFGDQSRVYVFNGASGAFLYTIESPNPGNPGFFGRDVKGMGDVTGDGVPDILVGATFESVESIVFAGRAYVFDGATGALVHSIVSPSPSVSGFLGYEVDGVPDLNDDGIDDIVVSAGGESSGLTGTASGKFHIYSGATGIFIRTLTSPNQGEGVPFGPAVSGIEDIDGDGAGDIIVGAWSEKGGGLVGAGRVYIFSGATGDVLRTFVSPNAVTNGSFGWDVAAMGDINNDGLSDLLIGAVDEDQTDISASGRAYVVTSDVSTGGGGGGEGGILGCAAEAGSHSPAGLLGDLVLLSVLIIVLLLAQRRGYMDRGCYRKN